MLLMLEKGSLFIFKVLPVLLMSISEPWLELLLRIVLGNAALTDKGVADVAVLDPLLLL
jgi:hypothetical protein